VDEQVRHVLRAGTQLQHGKNLSAGIDGEPKPQHLLVAPEPGAQFIQLQMREPKIGEEAFVQGLCMFASASEKGS